ncbi:MAG TPA: hypothetical protein VET89_11080 [Stellaceae bacterium]|nr:hypothetical protein [Stellaceae bacterium]
MKRLLTATASLAVVIGLAASTSAFAQQAGYTPTAATAPVYGPLPATPPPGMVPPGAAPPGFEYRYVYSYDQHQIYRPHWEAVRIGTP